MHYPLVSIQHGNIKSKHGPKNKQVNNLSCFHWNVKSLLAQSLSKISQIEANSSLYSHNKKTFLFQ